MVKLLYGLQPDEVYNLGAQSTFAFLSTNPRILVKSTGLAHSGFSRQYVKRIGNRYYQASSSEMFGARLIHKWKRPLSGLARRMAARRCMRTG